MHSLYTDGRRVQINDKGLSFHQLEPTNPSIPRTDVFVIVSCTFDMSDRLLRSDENGLGPYHN